MNKSLFKSASIFTVVIFTLLGFFSYQFSEDITCKKIFAIVENSGDENLTFWDPADFDVDDKENIYLLDTGNGRIQKFDKNGQFLKSIGRKGKGPGEFNFPNGIKLTEDSILIYDPENIRITSLTLEGNFLDSLTPRKYFSRITWDHNGNIYHADKTFVGGLPYFYLAKYNPKGEHEINIGKKVAWPSSAVKHIPAQSGSKTASVALYGGNILCAVDKENNVYIAYPYLSYEITKYSPEVKELLKLTKDSDMVLVSEADKEYLLEIYDQYDSVNMPKYKPFIKSLSTDEKNQNLWIATYKFENEGKIHFQIASQDGVFLGEVLIPDKNPRSVRKVCIKQNKLYILFYSVVEGAKLIKYEII